MTTTKTLAIAILALALGGCTNMKPISLGNDLTATIDKGGRVDLVSKGCGQLASCQADYGVATCVAVKNGTEAIMLLQNKATSK